jgi:hypothetical protein
MDGGRGGGVACNVEKSPLKMEAYRGLLKENSRISDFRISDQGLNLSDYWDSQKTSDCPSLATIIYNHK